jgi:hypothetical protein
MPLNTDISINVNASYSAALDLVTASAPLLKLYRTLFGSGTAAGQADKVFSDTRTITASSNDDLDLAGVLTDAFGVAITFVKVKAIIVVAAAANVNNVVIGGGASNPVSTFMTGTTPAILVRPGAMFALVAGSADATGYGVTATTADILRITNGGAGTSVTYDIIVIGTSA